jgi:hypothetical protein
MQSNLLKGYKPLTNTKTHLDNAKYFRIFAFLKKAPVVTSSWLAYNGSRF